jgi:hypothetical protein
MLFAKSLAAFTDERLQSNDRILDVYRWAQNYVRRARKRGQRPHPATVAALIIICEEFLGLDDSDALQALLGAKTRDQVVDSLIERKTAAAKRRANLKPDQGSERAATGIVR